MRRKRFQRGSIKPRKRRGKTYWYAQWREDGTARSKELGPCSTMTRAQAEGIFSNILQPIKAAARVAGMPRMDHTFGQFVEQVYIPDCLGKCKMISVLDFREKVVVRLATIEDMRPGEILAMQIGDLDLGQIASGIRRRIYRGNLDSPKHEAIGAGCCAIARDFGAVAGLYGQVDSKRPGRLGVSDRETAGTGAEKQLVEETSSAAANNDRTRVGDLSGDAPNLC